MLLRLYPIWNDEIVIAVVLVSSLGSVVTSSRKIRVANPEAVGDVERKLWNEIEPPIRDVLDELKANGKIETLYTLEPQLISLILT